MKVSVSACHYGFLDNTQCLVTENLMQSKNIKFILYLKRWKHAYIILYLNVDPFLYHYAGQAKPVTVRYWVIPKNMDYHYWTCFLLNPFIPNSHNQFQLQNQSTRLKEPNPVIHFDMIVTWIVLFIEIKKTHLNRSWFLPLYKEELKRTT